MRFGYLVAALVASSAVASDFVQELFDMHNKERQHNGLAPFECLDSQLSQLSADHVKYEVSIDNINHDGFSDRCRKVGNVACGENTLYDYVGDAAKFTQSWMNSPGHRKNILNPTYKHVGFAVQRGNGGKWFATAFFTDSNPRSNVCGGSNAKQSPPTSRPPAPTTRPQAPTRQPTPPPVHKVATPAPTNAPASSASDFAQQLFDMHNQERQRNGLQPYDCLDTQLSQLSADHVKYEVSIDNINHDGFSERCRKVGNVACGENTLYDYVGDASKFTQSWMNSPGHRKNILNGAYKHAGFAVQRGPSGKWFATAMFTDTNPATGVCANTKNSAKDNTRPSSVPSAKPSPAPWVQPTRVPTSKPSPAPWVEPTRAPSTKPSPAPWVQPTQPSQRAGGDMAQQLFEFHNQARQKNGLKPFTCLNSKLNSLSMDHVNYEIRAGKISHDGFGGRCEAAGNDGACAENTLYNYDGDAQGMTTQWMNSAGHRANILNAEYNNVGFAVKKASDGRYYATAIFTQDSRSCQ
ncbi:hypothetical protein ACHHYP_01612 [Achlya hypogyna]|uniref:Secreted protein n=1 Tax=Achlya hypogyna TaxID=1202772 RepID=A0A0A7CN45_ACHHY|nr:secreted protein [Achlya hypogyna]OQS01231.1 hypothetical protein ACHHYP_01612 [Achlya hypogyna]